jgi:heat shock protein HslJ
MRSLIALLALALLTIITACGDGSADDPAGRTWLLTELDGSAPIPETVVDLTIAEGTASGNAGCNTYTGPVDVNTDDNTMTFGTEIATTMMACQPAVMDQEQRFLTVLTEATSYEMANDTLTLLDANDVALATFE